MERRRRTGDRPGRGNAWRFLRRRLEQQRWADLRVAESTRSVADDLRARLGQRREPVDHGHAVGSANADDTDQLCLDRKSTRLNSSHLVISYAVFCLKKKK